MIAEAVKYKSILFIEDSDFTAKLIKSFFEKRKYKVRHFQNYIGISILINTHLIENYDAIIADFITPICDASHCLNILSKCSKPIIFYSCLDEKDFRERCLSKLGYIPDNFKFIQKSSFFSLEDIRQIIDSSLH